MKLITENRQARHEYFIEDTYQCGIVLEGSEVKSIRAGSINLKDSFCLIANGEVFVKNMHIAVYDKAGAYNTRNSKRDRKLLLRKAEINKLIGKVGEKGYALIPLEVYFEGSLCKLKMGLCKGNHTFDKKETIKLRDLDRSVERELKNYR